MRRFRFLPPLLLLLCLALPVRAAGTVEGLVFSESHPLAEGAELRREVWRFTDGEDRVVWLLQSDLSATTLRLATPGDDADNDGGSGHGAPLTEMAASAAEKGLRVLGGVNGDFYKTAADGGAEFPLYAPLGVMVKEGELLSEGQRAVGAAYFGVTKDGRAVMGSAAEDGDWDEASPTLRTAIGGELLLIRYGESRLSELRWRTDSPVLSARYGEAGSVYAPNGELCTAGHGLSSYPRTAAGILPDGSVVLVCVSIGGESRGVTVVQLTDLLLEMGCEAAMNLDGGPSTQLCADVGSGVEQMVRHGISGRIGDGLLLVEATPGEATERDKSGLSPLWALLLFPAVLLASRLLSGRKRGGHEKEE